MEEKRQEKMEELFNKLTEDNKEVISLVAKGMVLAQKGEKNDL